MDLTKNIDDHLNPVKILEITIKTWYNRVVSIAGLGKMYACDERFKKNIDIYGDGTAEFAADAIAVYTKKI